jgi:AcrR family transcriptional regulator
MIHLSIFVSMRVKDKQKTEIVYASTLSLVARIGLAGLTMPMIAKASGIATGTIYIYFRSKEDLVTELHKEVGRRFRSKVFSGNSPDRPIKEVLRNMWENLLSYSVSNHEEHVFLQQINVSPYTRENEPLFLTREVLAPLQEVLHAGQKQDLIKTDGDLIIQQLLSGFASQLAGLIHGNPALLTKDFINVTFSYFWDAIKK